MIKTIQVLLSILSAGFALFMFFKPALAIEIQRRFYLFINWRIEPVSMQKELRNTKIMGASLFIFVFLALFLISKIK